MWDPTFAPQFALADILNSGLNPPKLTVDEQEFLEYLAAGNNYGVPYRYLRDFSITRRVLRLGQASLIVRNGVQYIRRSPS